MAAALNSLLITIVLASCLNAADATGTLTGLVVDATNAPLPSAKICFRAAKIVQRCDAQTGADGSLRIDSLKPGIYSVDVVLRGFIPLQIPEVTIRARKQTNVGVLRLELLPCGVPGGPVCDTVTAPATSSPVDVPVVTVCEVLRDPDRYDHRIAIVVGALSSTEEGAWLDEDCGPVLVADGRTWPDVIDITYIATQFTPPPALPSGFKWDKRLLQQKLAAVKRTTRLQPRGRWLAIYGRLETKRARFLGFRGNAIETTYGYGPQPAAPAQIIAPDNGYRSLK